VLEQLTATRYVVPLREGGSLPAVVDTEDGGQFVVKFRGAGQGPRALVAELLAALLAHRLELPVPRVALVTVCEEFGRSEPDPEIQDLLRGSVGTNFGIEFLPGALPFDVTVDAIDPDLAAAIVWFDAYITNVDRTPRNPNLLHWRERLWMIDHGASFYFHHAPGDWQARAQAPFPQIREHVLLSRAGDLEAADGRLRPRLTEETVRGALALLPDEWLVDRQSADAEAQRAAYGAYLLARLEEPRRWLEEAVDARRRD
jgi:hypothetical protein